MTEVWFKVVEGIVVIIEVSNVNASVVASAVVVVVSLTFEMVE